MLVSLLNGDFRQMRQNIFTFRRKGRPRKDVDVGVIFHMLKNGAPIAAVARHIGIHRDTLYTNFRSVIEEARVSHHAAWKVISDEMLWKLLEKKR
jgi:hypothetical protein